MGFSGESEVVGDEDEDGDGEVAVVVVVDKLCRVARGCLDSNLMGTKALFGSFDFLAAESLSASLAGLRGVVDLAGLWGKLLLLLLMFVVGRLAVFGGNVAPKSAAGYFTLCSAATNG